MSLCESCQKLAERIEELEIVLAFPQSEREAKAYREIKVLQSKVRSAQRQLTAKTEIMSHVSESNEILCNKMFTALKAWRHMVASGMGFEPEWRQLFEDLWKFAENGGTQSLRGLIEETQKLGSDTVSDATFCVSSEVSCSVCEKPLEDKGAARQWCSDECYSKRDVSSQANTKGDS